MTKKELEDRVIAVMHRSLGVLDSPLPSRPFVVRQVAQEIIALVLKDQGAQ